MTDEERQVNEAIAGLGGSYVSNADRAAIAVRFGEMTAGKVAELYDMAMNPPTDWGTATDSMAVGLEAMHARLRERYPWLGDAAHRQLNMMFIMTWK